MHFCGDEARMIMMGAAGLTSAGWYFRAKACACWNKAVAVVGYLPAGLRRLPPFEGHQL